jgi:protein ImuA
MIMTAAAKITRLDELRALVSRRTPGMAAVEACSLGLPAIDAALGGGLPRGCLQEVIPADGGAAAAGFAGFLLARLTVGSGRRGLLWASLGEGDLYPPGLAAFGVDPAAVILLSAPGPAELLWAMEEGLRSSAIAGVVAEVERLDLTASRRLQLAAASGGGVGLLLMGADRPAAPVSAAALRWRVGARPGRCDEETGESSCWHVELLRQRAGRSGIGPCAWILERADETGRFRVAAALGDGSAAPPARRPGR